MPEYVGSDGYHGTLVRFRVGDLFKGKLCFIESLSYTMMDDVPWELDFGKTGDDLIGELPMGVDVSIGLKILGSSKDNRPAYNKDVIVPAYDWEFQSGEGISAEVDTDPFANIA